MCFYCKAFGKLLYELFYKLFYENAMNNVVNSAVKIYEKWIENIGKGIQGEGIDGSKSYF